MFIHCLKSINETFRFNVDFLIFVLLIVLLQSCSQYNCQNLPNAFLTYKEAKSKVRNSEGYDINQKSSLKSSWIKSAEYYSCDGKNGYLIITTKQGKSYIHSLVPKSVWSSFINSHSHGSYYVKNIKNKYQLSLD